MAPCQASSIALCAQGEDLVNQLRQAEFSAADFTSARFNLHTSIDGNRERLVVLVHGLGGKGYKTWGTVPEDLFSGKFGPAVDIGIFDYRSGHRRITKGTADFKYWSLQIGTQVRELESAYSEIFLVGHSMGGMLIEDVAMRYLVDRRFAGKYGSGPLAALVYIASPRAGSGWAVPILSSLIYEFRILRRFSARDAEIDSFYSTRVERLNVTVTAPGRIVLPAFAALAASDRLVTRFSSTFGVPETQRLYLEGGHTSIVKPKQTDDDLVGWLSRNVILACSDVRRQADRETWHNARARRTSTMGNQRSVVTKLISLPSNIEWAEQYHDARRSVDTPAVRVRDMDVVPESHGQVDLIIAIFDATHGSARTEPRDALLGRLKEEAESQPSALVGVCPVGQNSDAAVAAMSSTLFDRAEAYVIGANDMPELRAAIERLFRLAIRRRSDGWRKLGFEDEVFSDSGEWDGGTGS